MNLKQIADRLFEDSKLTPARGLSAIAEAEKYLQQAYEGRYFFELIQNVRDANKERKQDGEIFIELNNDLLSISNTGAEFSAKGIDGITTIGQSTKQSQDYIGFKGIGFKSIQEITEEPKIITQYGSVYFDRKLTLEKYNDQILKEEQIPLFYFPHFKERKLSNSEISKGIVTKIELPIKKSISVEKIIEAFAEIQAKQLILLGNIKKLYFETSNSTTNFLINKNPQKRIIEIQENDNLSIKFKYFIPTKKILIPEHVIQSLEGKEKDIFSKGCDIDVNIVIEIASNGQVKPIDDAKLYLFYPLLISSGFRFIIHSYFIVNPERTALRDSPLNNFLLSVIGEFIGGEMLRHLKKNKTNTNKILCFKRSPDAKINVLYDSVIIELKKHKFIYDSQTQKYFSSEEVMVADGFDKGLFPDGKLGGRQLIYTDDKEIIQWLEDEFEVPYLSYNDIENQIEIESKRQLKDRNLKFFQNLYNYVSQNERLNLTGKKVLLTDDWKLVSSEEDVFYGGGRRNPFNFALSIKRQIHFIHKDIKITDFREGKSRTGITEFNTYELTRRLLKLFNKASVPNADLLNALYNLQPLDTKSELEIKEKILLPVKGNSRWLSPLTNPIYFESETLKEIYPHGNFIDASFLNWEGKDNNLFPAEEFLLKFGVWEMPAIYINDKRTRVPTNDKRNKKIENASGLTSRPYYIKNDRILDKPNEYTYWFTNAIINNWSFYENFITSKLLPILQYDSSQSYSRNANDSLTIEFSDFIETLSSQEWIVFHGEEEVYSVSEIVGIKYLDFSQAHNQVIGRYLKLLPINYDLKKDLVEAIGLIHLDGDSIQNFIKLLNHIHDKFKNIIPATKDFTDFYNRILSKLVDFFYNNNQTNSIIQLKDEFFLSVDDLSKINLWTKANQIFHIDDKPNYDLLPVSIKERVQPHFTNRDRNTFGKIASKIGKKYSNSIQKELIETNVIQSFTLLTFFEHLPESIAILESTLDIIMNEYLEKVKVIRVFEKEIIKVKIAVGNSDEIIINASHYVDNVLDIHISRADSSNRNKQIAESVSELFINLLGRDLRKYHSDLLRFLNTPDKKEYLRDYDILDERVNEIRDKLNTSDLTSNQLFWEAILTGKEISNRRNIFTTKDIDITNLAELLEIDEELVKKIQENFNFQQTSASSNILLLSDLVDSLNLTLQSLNKNLFPKIDFRYYYENKLSNLKNKFENGFNAILHTYLANQRNDEKQNYQDILDNYKRCFEFLIPLHTLVLDTKSFFLESINAEFSFLKISSTDLEKNFSSFNSVSIYSSNLSLLKSRLITIEFTNEIIENFLVENKKRSLLYFNQVDFLADSFKEWFQHYKERYKPAGLEEEVESYLNAFTNQTDIEITEVSTSQIEAPCSSSSGLIGGNGKRFDGAANDASKKLIGLVAEMVVYEKLKTLHNNVNWVSKFANKVPKRHPGYNPEGQDGLGYDIEYLDNDGNKFFVEVKGRSDNYDSFEISKNELNRAYKEKEFYKIIFVTHTLNNSQRRIRDLGNLFLLDSGEDFLSNRKFKAIYHNFEIRFKEL